MTITEPKIHPSPSPSPARGPDVPDAPFTRAAGTLAILAGALITVAQLTWLPFDPKDHQATSQDPLFQVGGVIYVLGFVLLLLALIGAHGWQARRAGRFGMVALGLAVTGTMLLGGDLWFEAFAIPWVADSPAPQILESDPTILIGLGAVASYLCFAVGWALFGVASFRARVFPRGLAVALVVSGVIGFQALVSPFALPLAATVIGLGLWLRWHQEA